jgi:acyl-CoA synthetase (AMP-forming)/AMP-acid ligase II
VALLLPSSLDYQIAYAACVRLGAITSGINLRLGAPEASSILERTRPTVTVVDDGVAPPPGPTGAVVVRAELAAAVDGPAPRFPTLEPSDPVCVVWTSGTTGLPKGAVFDHRNLRAVADGIDVLSAPGDRRLSPLPFAHVGSMTRLWDELAHAVTTVITPTPWRAEDAVRILAEERITVGQGVPTQWALVLARPELDDLDLSALRIAGTGAARIPPELVVALRDRLGVPAVVRYTSTETSLGTGTSPDDPVEVVTGTVGRPVPGVELELVADDGTPVGRGQVGRVRIRSGAVMRGYWGGPPTGPGSDGIQFDEEATDAVLDADGWITTGDYGERDGAGHLVLRGRANELYLRGGYNVYPAEVEGVLGGHPDVDQVAVVGAPDPVLGEIGVAFVVAHRGADGPDPDRLLAELRDLARSRLADYKAPDRLVVLDALPLTSMLKVDKRALAAPAAAAASTPRPQPVPTKGAVP